jgi:EAL domain-containing protein (putative c-di-GMP-specific phosphodiesterase class I)
MSALRLEYLEAGDIVFRAGERGDAAYVIESGAVEILLGAGPDYRRINVRGPGSLFGEVALLDGKPRTATVRALVRTRLVRIQQSHLESLMGRADPVVQYLIRVLLDYVRRSADIPAPAQGKPFDSSLPQAPLPEFAGSDVDISAELHQSAYRTLSLAQSLSEAIDSDQLALHYQPIVRFSDGKLAGFEALIRWRHPTLGMIRPDEFIPLAEKTDLIHRIGDFVLLRASADWKQLREQCENDDGHPRFMSVNLSAPEFCQPGIVERVAAAMQGQRMEPSELRIELTETAVISNLTVVSGVAERLRAMGVGIALDDFGKGYAGLDTLQSLPFSCLKIDKAFVDRMHASERSCQIIRSTLELARLLGMTTVAEGIEDRNTLDVLSGMGCVYAQGYHFGRPMPVPDRTSSGTVTAPAIGP